MTSKLELDPRLDPRIKAAFVGVPTGTPQPDVSSREELLAQELSAEGLAVYARQVAIFDSMDREDIAPSAGLTVRTETFTSAPDGNTVKIQYIRPEGDQTLPCIYYIHGGRMAFSSCYEGNYKAWGRMIAARGVAVAMVDFRNAVHADSAPEIAPFPAGLNDCVSGLKWVRANASLARHRSGAHRRRGRKRRRQSRPRGRHEAEAGRRSWPDQGHLRHVPLHRRGVAAAAVPFFDRERGHRDLGAQQPQRHGLRHRRLQRPQPARLARLRSARGCPGPAAGGDQRQRVRPACATKASPSTGSCSAPAFRRAAASSWACATRMKFCPSSARTSPAPQPATLPTSRSVEPNPRCFAKTPVSRDPS